MATKAADPVRSTPANRFRSTRRIRRIFGSIGEAVQMPNLIEVQRESYHQFLFSRPQDAYVSGLEKTLRSVFPIRDFAGTAELDFVSYELEDPKYDKEECRQRGMTFAAPMRVTLRLIVFEVDPDTGTRSVIDIKEQDVYMGDMPLMTENGTFLVNGTERVIVSQMHRSPGVFFDHDRGKTHSSGKYLFAARVIPYRGSWLDFEFDAKDIVNVRIDRKRKLPVTALLYALGLNSEEVLHHFYGQVRWERDARLNGWRMPYVAEQWRGVKPGYDVLNAETGELLFPEGQKVTPRTARKAQTDGVQTLLVPNDEIIGRYSAHDLINEQTGAIYIEAGDEIAQEHLDALAEAGFAHIDVLDIDNVNVGPWIRNTMKADKATAADSTRDQALADIYRVMRPGEPPTRETAEALFAGLFFDAERYDLSAVGRVKMNMRLGLDAPDDLTTLRNEDILAVVKTLVDLKDGKGEIDDIDNLGNRRVRSVGELLENSYRVGLLRMERAVKERMSSVDISTVMPNDLINAKPAVAAVREFFGSSQLSQFMDQTNPLSEVTHKRRVSALGPGGLTRERAGFEVRDVHPTHYGRICPIETPEGPNIGLINSLSTFSRVNKYGFIETPYRKVIDCKVTDEVNYLSAMEEARHTIAQANVELDAEGRIVDELVSARQAGEFLIAPREQITLMDVSPKQLVSVAASLIPFLESDDANRALMGSNMQRQAVPLVKAEAPFVGTGMEETVARDSGAAIAARRAGIVDQVDAGRIVIRATEDVEPGKSMVDIYTLMKFQRSNQDTCINQRPLVKVGDLVAKGDIICDGPSTQYGELALGRNALVAFMPWNGYNYEDSILINERIVREDIFTSIHIEEFEVMARDTKLGPEDITRDIPNVGEEALRNLDEAGIVYVGAEVEPGDILIGKITPKGESPMTPEEKLLRAIFGEKASDVRDSSLRLPPGVAGTVVEVRVFNRHGIDKDERALSIEREEITRLEKDAEDERSILDRATFAHLRDMLLGQTVVAAPKGVKKGVLIDEELLSSVARRDWWKFGVADDQVQANLEASRAQYDAQLQSIAARLEDRKDKLQRGDDMAPGVLKMVKVFVAVKRKLQPGDKMAGRHGNKGVISRILPSEDMPFLEDGTAVDIVLNPLGVPSRMNVGQIFETHLGWAARGLGRQINGLLEDIRHKNETAVAEAKGDLDLLRQKLGAIYGTQVDVASISDEELMAFAESLVPGVPMGTPVFDGAKESDVSNMLELAGLDSSGQVELFDGRTGEAFDRKVTVGYIYMLKLHHLVDDKIHARSIGPYSLVTQQPLGGKAQFGGQRFGEMEVWALQAYGAAYTLQEMLTVKSDDVVGRTKVYEAIVKGDDTFEAGIPESFNVLVKEMRSLGLNVELKTSDIDAEA
ncbi:DNA-directed RNA polymerase subunit beta [Sandaracinobacteroides sp. A072]|uniref:DNA-directed RNA polymerase subunit beta n=1 Tax=Sandaracinobacteroides sp. A072 TaxID=3461146 RepID=UPI0040419FA7